jgi:transposase InsO family protein
VSAFLSGATNPPEAERKQLLSAAHHFSHLGSKGIVDDLVRRNFYWSSMRADAENLVANCLACQKFNYKKRGYNPLTSFTSPSPMHHIVIDLIGPLPTSPLGRNWILVVVDVHTRYIWLRALSDKTAASVASELLLIFRDFGAPAIIGSDNGSEFDNALLQSLADQLSISLRLTSPYNPRANGIAERHVQSTLQMIRKELQGETSAWPTLLLGTQVVLNHRISGAHNSRPFEAMFLRPSNYPFQFPSLSPTETTSEPLTPPTLQTASSELIQERFNHAQSIVFPALQATQDAASAARQERHDRTHIIRRSPLPVGTLVMIDNVTRKNKFESPREGPYRIVSVTKNGSYNLQDDTGDILPRSVPSHQVHNIGSDIPFGNSFTLSSIIAHRGPPHQREYKIRWKGRPSSEDSWEPTANINDPAAITTYWSRRGLPSDPEPSTTQPVTETRHPTLSSSQPFDILLPSEQFASYPPPLPSSSTTLRHTSIAILWDDNTWERTTISKLLPGRNPPNTQRVELLFPLSDTRRDRTLTTSTFVTPSTLSSNHIYPPGSWTIISSRVSSTN